MRNMQQVRTLIRTLQQQHAARDSRWFHVASVRGGDMGKAFPAIFGDEFKYPMVANHLDTVARDLSESIAPLPALNCTNSQQRSDAARKAATLKQKIGRHYWQDCQLEWQMFGAADNYITFGMAVAEVEPDFERMAPKIRFINPMGCYPELDRDRKVLSLTRVWRLTKNEIYAQWPEAQGQLEARNSGAYGQNTGGAVEFSVCRYIDKDQYLVFVLERMLPLSQVQNKLGVCPVEVGLRPSGDDQVRGQFDDVLGVQAARAIMMKLAVEAAQKNVAAPLAVPDDMVEVPIGPDALLRSSMPEKIHRVPLGIDGATFAENQALQQELLNGSRYPGARQGALQGSVITGRGVEELMGGFDSQIKSAQIVFAAMLQRLTALCFRMDETYWGSRTKEVQGVVEGAPYQATYSPRAAIAGDYTCDVTYGFMAGLDPNRALVFLLQLRGDQSIDRDTLQRNLPFDVDVEQLQAKIEVEKLRDAAHEGIAAYVQIIGQLAASGQDPTGPLKVVASTIKGIQKGQPVEDLLLAGFQQIEQEQQAAQQAAQAAQQEQQGGGPGGQGLPGVQPSGLPAGVAPGQAGMAPGGRPDLQTLMAGFGSSGKPTLSAGVRRSLPT
jgi:hypothetical protein